MDELDSMLREDDLKNDNKSDVNLDMLMDDTGEDYYLASQSEIDKLRAQESTWDSENELEW